MTKPRGIDWLEQQTNQQIDRPTPTAAKVRHISIRVSDDLYAQLERLAHARDESVSHCARQLLLDGLVDRAAPTVAIDDAITALQRARAHIAS